MLEYLAMLAESVPGIFKSAKWIAFWFMAVAGLAVTGLAQRVTAPTGVFNVEETLLGTFRPDLDNTPWIVSADMRHVVYLARGESCPSGMKRCVILDGQPTPGRHEASRFGLALSFDGKHVAYVTDEGKKWAVVVDGQPGQGFDGGMLSGPTGLIFSPDGKRLAYLADVGKRRVAVVDSQAGAGYDQILPPVFSPDSRRVGYAARTGKHWTVVVDGQPGPEFDGNWASGPFYLTFSSDSQHVAYAARKGMQWSVVLDGRPGVAYDDIVGPTFSPDSRHIAYGARQGDKWQAVVDDQAGMAYDAPTDWSKGPGPPAPGRLVGIQPHFSDDSKQVSYVAQSRGIWTAIVDGQWVANAYLAEKNRKCVVVVGSRELAECEEGSMGYPAISPDGRRMAFSVKTAGKNSEGNDRVVVDGELGPPFLKVSNPSFSPDGKHVVYTAAGGVSLALQNEAENSGFLPG